MAGTRLYLASPALRVGRTQRPLCLMQGPIGFRGPPGIPGAPGRVVRVLLPLPRSAGSRGNGEAVTQNPGSCLGHTESFPPRFQGDRGERGLDGFRGPKGDLVSDKEPDLLVLLGGTLILACYPSTPLPSGSQDTGAFPGRLEPCLGGGRGQVHLQQWHSWVGGTAWQEGLRDSTYSHPHPVRPRAELVPKASPEWLGLVESR